MIRQNPHLLLMGALQFSAVDLSANRRGQLSQSQRQQLVAERQRDFHTAIVAVLLLVIIEAVLRAPMLVILFTGAAGFSVMVAVWMRGETNLSQPVEAATGFVKRSPQWWRSGYHLCIDGQVFQVSRAAGAAFAPGRLYRLYFPAASREILSAEVVN